MELIIKERLNRKAPAFHIRLGTVVFIALTLFTSIPLILFFYVSKQEIITELSHLEEEQQLNEVKEELDALKLRINKYYSGIEFLSQLPSVLEILGKGQKLLGSIDSEKACGRYGGVLSRAFEAKRDIVSIRIFKTNFQIQFTFDNNYDIAKHTRRSIKNLNIEHKLIQEVLEMKEKGFVTNPFFVNVTDSREDNVIDHKLFLSLYTPIFSEKKVVGVYCCDIDVGTLSNFYPSIFWVLDNGDFLESKDHHNNAFNNFPGLKKLFDGKEAAIWKQDKDMMAWIPFIRGKYDSLSLWAGKKVTLKIMQRAQAEMFIHIMKFFISLLVILFILTILLSKLINRLSKKFLDSFKKSILNSRNLFANTPSYRVRELSLFIRNTSYIIDENIKLEEKKQSNLVKLQKLLDEVKDLRGIIPICSYCKNIRNDNGYYEKIETYLHKYSGADFSHTICPDCLKKHFPNFHNKNDHYT